MRAAWVALLLLAGCGYRPAADTNVEAKAYKTDLAACEERAHSTVAKQNAKRALTWLASPVRRWGQISDATESCMATKGYGRVRWCTADELTSGTRSGVVVVTAAGIQCSEKPLKPAT